MDIYRSFFLLTLIIILSIFTLIEPMSNQTQQNQQSNTQQDNCCNQVASYNILKHQIEQNTSNIQNLTKQVSSINNKFTQLEDTLNKN